MLPRPPTTAAAKIGRMKRKPVSGSIEVPSPSSMPPAPTSPIAMKTVSRPTQTGSIPFNSARVGLSATARIALPIRVNFSAAKTAVMMIRASTKFWTCCGPTRIPATRQSRTRGRS